MTDIPEWIVEKAQEALDRYYVARMAAVLKGKPQGQGAGKREMARIMQEVAERAVAEEREELRAMREVGLTSTDESPTPDDAPADEPRFIAGDDLKDEEADHASYGIHDRYPGNGHTWFQRIVVYGDNPDLRDLIVRVLNELPHR